MMEGMNQSGQEEYIWAMRTSLYRESDSDLWKTRQSLVASQATLNKRKVKSLTGAGGGTSYEFQSRVMASLVPDEVIYNVNDYSHRKYDACFLFGDVSGFTELCEKYNKVGLSGPSRMTQVLNKYLGSMVQEVLSQNGDVLKFSGDAFLVMFKSTESTTMRDCVHEAMDSALVIQKNYGSYMTDVGVVIRVKLAISAGSVTFALIGDPKMSHYIVVGKPIWDVKAAEHISSAGDIVVAPAAWHYVNPNEYHFTEMPDNIHIKLIGIGPNWRSVQKNVRHDETPSIGSDSTDSDDSWSEDLGTQNDEISLRPAVNLAVRLKIRENMRRFIIAPVMKSIDMSEPFEYLTEMRQAVIVFINVVSQKLDVTESVILVDTIYKIVCGVVDKMKGCVNKVSLFDKDLMLVVIFGLRGLKHELECQVALRCAKECHDLISALPKVISASFGVTTGKTYCGIFGHTLRREYTVISLLVNKAARLMVAYKGKVTCDRETFLHSKLEARHFILQEFKPLKGISHPGPVYEYVESDEHHGELHRINPRPLLGRNGKLELYKNLLRRCLGAKRPDENQYKMLLIRGEARQGKTRVLDELVYITPQKIGVNRFKLTPKDHKIPYLTMRLFFFLPMSLTEESSVKQKEQKILELLRKIQVPDMLCSLNSVFNVHFRKSDVYLSLSEQQKHIALTKLIKQLCYVCFTNFFVTAIDDCEYIDEESWRLIPTLLEINTLFIVATVSRDRLEYSEHINKLTKDPRVKVTELHPVERWYLGALACHILDVYAISPELENAIQTRSNGNPGWIESFLISMIQDGALYTLKASMRDVNDLGLVAPPLYMMARLSKEEAFKWQNIMEEKKKDSVEDPHIKDYWQRYIDSCRDSYLNITIRELLESLTTGGKVPICVIAPTFHVGEEEAELTMDTMILKTFDSLNFFEQLLVKCSAILGEQFLRDMLVYVMNATDQKKFALAVQKLFEIKVLTCAKGDFVDDYARISRDKLVDPNAEEAITCKCKGISIREECRDLPIYASCGYMQFRSSLFRNITYNLLTDNQKKEFHQRAIRYIERETRKCKACGGGYFENILGEKREKELAGKGKRKKARDDDVSWETASAFSHRLSIYSTSTTMSSSSTTKRRLEEKSDKSVAGFQSHHMLEKPVEKKEPKFGFTMIKKLKNSFSLTRAFSSEDFTDCQCLLILSTTYAQLIEHTVGANDSNKTIEAMLEYAQTSTLLRNMPLALKILHETLEVLKGKDQQETKQPWKLALIRAKIYNLIGYGRIELGHFRTAFRFLHKALKELGTTFPTSKFQRRMRICNHETKQMFAFYVFPNTLTKRLDYWETAFCNTLAECLSYLYTLYKIKGDWENAELTAAWALTKALQSFSNFQILFRACCNMLNVARHFRKWKMCLALEIHSLKICHMKKSELNAEDLRCVAKLYAEIFSLRLIRSKMDRTIHMGYVVLRICTSIRAVKIILPVLPLLFHVLMLGTHFSNANGILQELEFFSTEDSDSSGKVWHLALAVCAVLETGCTVMPIKVCENFYQVEGDSWITIRDPDARKRFFTVMWLWCVRNERWEEASSWCLKNNEFTIIKEDDSEANKITALYLLEGMIIYLVCKLDRRNVEAVIKAEKEIKTLIDALENAGKVSPIILPRLYHLKAYFEFVKAFDSKVTRLMDKATKLAVKYGNSLEAQWIDHSLKAWNRTLPTTALEFWREHSEGDDGLHAFQDIEVEGQKIGFFTLPTPFYA